MTGTKAKIQQFQRTLSGIDAKNSTFMYIISKLQKAKDRNKILKDDEWRGISCLQRNRNKNNSRLLLRNPCKQEESEVKYLSCWKKKNKSRIIKKCMIPWKVKEKTNNLSGKQKWREFISKELL